MKKLALSLILPAWTVCHLGAVDVSNLMPVDQNTTVAPTPPVKNAIFGAHLFNGNFQVQQHIYNPEYRIGIGDVISLKMWGAFSYEQPLTVDSQGNIFIPGIGTVQLLGVRNGDLVTLITEKVKKSTRKMSLSMQTWEPTKMSLFLLPAMSANPDFTKDLAQTHCCSTSTKPLASTRVWQFRKIKILRENKVLKDVDLYEFLLQGKMDLLPFVAAMSS